MQFDADQIRRDNPLDAVVSRFGVKLTKDGKEWLGLCSFHAEKTPSFTIFPSKSGLQRFQCFGCGEGGDVIDFVQAWENCGFTEACEVLGGKRGRREVIPVAAPPPSESVTYLPPPAGLTIMPGHTVEVWNPKRNRMATYRPKTVYAYPGLGYVLRIELDEGRKFTPAVLWDGARWTHGSMPEPRPLYGLAGLLERPKAQVLVVEGEKCRDAAALALPGKVAVSWCGGGKAAAKSDWSVLAGRSVLIWPDLDEAGIATGRTVADLAVAAGASAVKLLDLDGLDRPKGWDIADAIGKDWMDRDDLIQFMRSRVRPWPAKEVMPHAGDAHKSMAKPEQPKHAARPRGLNGHGAVAAVKAAAIAVAAQKNPTPQRDNVQSLHGAPLPLTDDLDAYRENLLTNEEGKLKPKMASNFYWMLRGHPDTRHLFAFNDVAQGVFLMRPPPWDEVPPTRWTPRALTDADISKAAMWLEARQLSPKKSETRDVIKAVAGHARFNPIRDYLQALRWDGIPRLAGGLWEGDSQPHAATEYLGAPPDEIFGTFLTKWHISAVARIMRPGCKADCMLIVEGAQGKMKSTYLRMMATIGGHEYFADGIGDIANKDSIMLMAGCWIVENAEMDGFSRQDLRTIKAWLSRTTDRYIPKFESEPREVPRTFVVSGTHNPSGHGYLKDPTGNRRFWPLPVTSIDLARITADKDQIWAEAVARFTAGETWWLSAEEESLCDRLTSDRRSVDPWWYKLEAIIGMNHSISVAHALREMAIPIAQQNELTIKRLGDVLRGRGFRQDGPDRWERETG